MNPEQGQLVRLSSSPDQTYQVLSIDADSDSCWVRRWPLSRHGSPPFAVSLEALRLDGAALDQAGVMDLAPT